MQLLVTRPAAQADDWVQRLRAEGVAAWALPLIEIAPLADIAPLRAAWQVLADQAFVMFVSANAVQAFFDARPSALHWPEATVAGATGPGTVAALLRAGLRADRIQSPPADAASFDAEALWAEIARAPLSRWQGQRVLVVRGEDGRDWLAERWREHGARVDFIAAYRRGLPHWSEAQRERCDAALAQPDDWLWLMSSSEALSNLRSLCPQADFHASRALATHERIGAAARRLGFGAVLPVLPNLLAVAGAMRSLQSVAS